MSKAIAIYLLEVLAKIKMFHWFAQSYDEHKIYDDLYEDLAEQIDDLMEVLLGCEHLKIPRNYPAVKATALSLLAQLNSVVEQIDVPEAAAPIENILQITLKYKYLLLL